MEWNTRLLNESLPAGNSDHVTKGIRSWGSPRERISVYSNNPCEYCHWSILSVVTCLTLCIIWHAIGLYAAHFCELIVPLAPFLFALISLVLLFVYYYMSYLHVLFYVLVLLFLGEGKRANKYTEGIITLQFITLGRTNKIILWRTNRISLLCTYLFSLSLSHRI